MGCITAPMAMIGSSALGAGASIFGASMQSSAAEQAAQDQMMAAEQAQQLMFKEFGITQANMAPFIQGGQGAMNSLAALTGGGPGGKGFLNSYFGQTFAPTQANLAATPGYQFTLNQGEQAVQNSMAAQGLGKSGAEAKGAANYAEGLASTTYQQQFQNWLQQRQTQYNYLSGMAGIGENAAAQQGQIGTSQMANIGNLITGAGAAQAAGTIGSANAWTNGLFGLTNGLSGNALMYALMGGMGGGGGNMFSQIGASNPGYWSDFSQSQLGGLGTDFTGGGG